MLLICVLQACSKAPGVPALQPGRFHRPAEGLSGRYTCSSSSQQGGSISICSTQQGPRVCCQMHQRRCCGRLPQVCCWKAHHALQLRGGKTATAIAFWPQYSTFPPLFLHAACLHEETVRYYPILLACTCADHVVLACCFAVLQVCMLLHRMGLDASDTRPIKRANLSGAELLLLSEQQLVTLLDVPLHKARRLMRLQVGSFKLCWPVLVWFWTPATCMTQQLIPCFLQSATQLCWLYLSDRFLVLHLM